jgi:hypothetical protein
MPELTWTTWLAWFGVLTGAASVASLIIGGILGLVTWRQNRATTQLITDGHAATQLTLKDIAKGFNEGQQALGQVVTGLGQILERMDQRADERHREVVQLLETWRR